ncbi:LIM and SH3 domain protein Lasp, partial [Nilaparvata lugens]|uniref:LIM and SH3 domain protein Lasp n=1 Tax=Nilaparvata lugens TaxID=108931 RepID=UPI00193CED63
LTLEELKCLDKIWHKQCFKCQVCNMTLNMRNYKGFNKDPYCEAHIPKAKATTVAETPELKRIAENTKIQSNVMYHAEFEKTKGKLTQVADDPETLRIKQNSKIISNVAYHGDLQKKAAMEQKRNMNENGDFKPSMSIHPANYLGKYLNCSNDRFLLVISFAVNTPQGRRIGSIADLDPVNDFYGSLGSEYNQGGAPAPSANHTRTSGRVYRAMYDYEAQDRDEVSFLDGDLIVNCTPIDEGWMTGTVQRTGQTGMLPANYVQQAI